MNQLTLFVEDSPAKTSQQQEKVQGLQENVAVCGMNSTDSSKKSNRNTQLSKMSQLFDLEDWIKCSGASLRSGMMQNGIVFQLPPLAHLTDGIVSGSWPTPNANGTTLGQWGGSTNSIRKNPTLASGKLNPTWVEWLMGFPEGWTDLDN